jgi:WD40 repeat protein
MGPPVRLPAPATGVAFSPDGTTLATAAGAFGDPTPVRTDQTVQLWDVAARRLLPVSLGGHTASVNRVAFSPDGQLLATGGNDSLVVLHDPRTGATVGTPMSVDSPVYSLAFSPDSSRVAIGGSGQNVFVFDIGTGRQVGSPLRAGIASSVAFSPDGSLLVTGSTFDSNTIVWDAATLTMIGTPMSSFGAGVAFHPDGHEFAVADYKGRVTLWSPESAPLIIRRIPGTSRYGGLYGPDGTVLAVRDTNTVTLYDARTFRPLGPPLDAPGGTPVQGLGAIPARVAFSPDGTRLAVAGLGASVELFDVRTLRHVGASVPLESPALSLAFSPDGSILAVGGTQGDALYLVDLPSGRRRGPLAPSGIVLNLAFSPDGRRLVATTAIGVGVVYDHLRRAAPRATPLRDDRGNVSAARFSPDGSLLATGGLDGSLRLRDGHTLRPLGPSTQTNDSQVVGIDFAPDSRMLAVADLRGTFRLVDAATRQPIGDALVGPGVGRPSFRPDGRVLALSAYGGTALLSLDLAEWRADACRLAGRDLTRAERREYLGARAPRVVACSGTPTPR